MSLLTLGFVALIYRLTWILLNQNSWICNFLKLQQYYPIVTKLRDAVSRKWELLLIAIYKKLFKSILPNFLNKETTAITTTTTKTVKAKELLKKKIVEYNCLQLLLLFSIILIIILLKQICVQLPTKGNRNKTRIKLNT